MKQYLILGSIAGSVFVAGAASTLMGQAAPAPSAVPHGVALVDSEYIFSKYAGLQEQVTALSDKAKALQAEMQKDQQAFQKQAEALQDLNAGSPEYKETEARLAKQGTDLQLKYRQRESDLKDEQRKMAVAAHTKLQAAVQAYCQQRGMSLALNFDGEPFDPKNITPEAVQREALKLVVWHSPEVDITPTILRSLNGPGVARKPAAGGPAAQR